MKSRRLGPVDWSSYGPAPVVGVDEVGRGCLAGPVVAAAVILNVPQKSKNSKGLRKPRFFDSKALSEARREELARVIQAEHRWSVAFATVEEIDRLNILRASLLAMKRAVEGLGEVGGHILVDGKFVIPEMSSDWVQTALVKGDSRAQPISAASIVAKVARDRWMKRLAELYPGYGFEVHKGYGTKLHRARLGEMGACELHRLSFAGIGETFARDGVRGPSEARECGLDAALS